MSAQPTALHSLFKEWGAEFITQGGAILPVRVSGAGTEYEAARDGVALFDGGDRAWIEITGPDTENFLQRILSSDIKKLKPGMGQWSAMLDGKGHWVAELVLYRFESGPIDVFALDMPFDCMDLVFKHLEKMHFNEDLSWSAYKPARLLITGKRSLKTLQQHQLPTHFAKNNFFKSFGIHRSDRGFLILSRPDRGVPCCEIQGSPSIVTLFAKKLHENGAVPGGFTVLDILRIEAGRPVWGIDFDSSMTLPEADEWHRVSFSKGCYTGQEVVAKIHTYGRAPRSIVPLTFDKGERPLRGASLQDSDNKQVGVVTSWSWSPVRDVPIGLGLVKKKAIEASDELRAVLPDDTEHRQHGGELTTIDHLESSEKE